MLSNDFLYSNPSNLVVFPDNHDIQRFYTLIDEDFDLFKTAMIYVATIDRIPQIFYGTEYLAVSPGEKHDGRIRSDFPGGWEGDKVNAFTGVGLSNQQLEAQNFTRKLFNWRKENPVIHSGSLKHFAPENGIYVFFRYNKEKTVMVILNKNKENITLNTERFKEIISEYTTGNNVITGRKHKLNTLELSARTSLILELSK
jgi:glycosidase